MLCCNPGLQAKRAGLMWDATVGIKDQIAYIKDLGFDAVWWVHACRI
jgi:glycosidase